LLRVAGALLVTGFVLELVAEFFHPSREHPNNHPAVFAEYARSDAWVAVHFGQFAAVVLGLVGFFVLARALEVRGTVPVLARLATAAATAAVAVWAVLQAIDGVALKQAVDAWSSASGTEKAVRFANAETVRWTEWAVNSYFRVLFGTTVLLFGVALARTAILPRWLGWVGVLTGLLSMAVGVTVGYEGFEAHIQGLAAALLFAVFAVGVLAAAVRAENTARVDQVSGDP